jgi:hypothetical protein
LVVIALLVIAILVLLWLLSRQPAPAPAPAPTNTVTTPTGGLQPTTPTNTDVSTPVATPEPAPAPAPDGSAALTRLAMAFAERYGSYSNQSDFVNLLDLRALMTQAMAARTDRFVESARASFDPNDGYLGTTTRALTADLDSFDDDAGLATVTVTTQRREASGLAADRVYYQELELDFEKVSGEWLIDTATWGEASEQPAS